jgi:hypothetical protein
MSPCVWLLWLRHGLTWAGEWSIETIETRD